MSEADKAIKLSKESGTWEQVVTNEQRSVKEAVEDILELQNKLERTEARVAELELLLKCEKCEGLEAHLKIAVETLRRMDNEYPSMGEEYSRIAREALEQIERGEKK